ncbi:MAG TPA: 50S ribosomal protein L5 [Candidatus Paceibacterota bacterium]|nr:50S ribosomal protein L5 [Candidatus Paceibacterota bacterium]
MMTKEKLANAFEALKGEFGYTNVNASPRLMKIVVSSGVGKADKTKKALVENRLARITGQKAAPRASKQSIAQFKMRQGEIIGFQVTLRGARMHEFLDKLIHITLPRTRDFRGLNISAVDEMGNLTIGIKDHTIFPETADEDLKDVFGLAITLVTTAKTKAEAEAYFRYLGIPFKKD